MKQITRVFNAINDGNWKTLEELASATGDSQQSIASRLRDLRIQTYGGHRVEARIKDPSKQIWEYRLDTGNAVSVAAAPQTMGAQLPNNQPVRFLNLVSWQTEVVPRSECRVEPCGKFTRVVATDDNDCIIPHLVTTQSNLMDD
jgi:hypothetical protein